MRWILDLIFRRRQKPAVIKFTWPEQIDHGEAWNPKCRVCGSENLQPDPGGYYRDAEDRYGAPLLCTDHEK